MFARMRTINTSEKVDAEHEQLIWTHPGMTTYYRNSQGRVFSAMPWRFVDYWAMTHDPDFAQIPSDQRREVDLIARRAGFLNIALL